MRRIKDLPGWPPPDFSGAGPAGAGEATIQDVLHVSKSQVQFSCTIKGAASTCSFAVPDLNTAEQVAAVLKKYRGKNLLAIADEPIPETGTLSAEAAVRGHPYP